MVSRSLPYRVVVDRLVVDRFVVDGLVVNGLMVDWLVVDGGCVQGCVVRVGVGPVVCEGHGGQGREGYDLEGG